MCSSPLATWFLPGVSALSLGPTLLCESVSVNEEEEEETDADHGANILVNKLQDLFSPKHAFVTIFQVQELDCDRGKQLAVSFCNALRMFQTHVLKNSNQFYLLFTSPETPPLDFSKMFLKNGGQWLILPKAGRQGLDRHAL
eukprot:m.248571 g.248571  ORF g.248571 m.248571 type:complete len:142 (-) comp15757_c0_seq1:258-683(-)